MTTLRTIVSGLGFAEAPRWHDGKIWFVDFFARTVQTVDLAGNRAVVATLDDMPGGLGFLPDGTPIVVAQTSFRLLAIAADGSTSLYADLSGHARGAANELLIDADGTAWVGHHGFDFFGGAEPRPSSLIRVGSDGTVSEAADGLVFPNGMVRSGNTLIVAESFANRLTAFDIGADGILTNRSVWAQLGDDTPDGIALDAEGAVWISSPMTSRFVRVAQGGEVLDTIEVPGCWAVACAFVDDDLSQLACVIAETSIEGMPKGESKAHVALARVDVGGMA